MTVDINLREVELRITEHIWLRAFGTSLEPDAQDFRYAWNIIRHWIKEKFL